MGNLQSAAKRVNQQPTGQAAAQDYHTVFLWEAETDGLSRAMGSCLGTMPYLSLLSLTHRDDL